jgi:hypothetical protein
MSKGLKAHRNLTWLRKGAGIPEGSATAKFNRDSSSVATAQRANATSTLGDWFDGDDVEIEEDVVGLGEYGRTLTVLWADSLPETVEPKAREDEDSESLLPSQRFYRKTRY